MILTSIVRQACTVVRLRPSLGHKQVASEACFTLRGPMTQTSRVEDLYNGSCCAHTGVDVHCMLTDSYEGQQEADNASGHMSHSCQTNSL